MVLREDSSSSQLIEKITVDSSGLEALIKLGELLGSENIIDSNDLIQFKKKYGSKIDNLALKSDLVSGYLTTLEKKYQNKV